MTPKDFLEQIARPNVEEFSANFDDLRRAFNAIAAVDALAAHMYEWCKINAPQEIAGIKNDLTIEKSLRSESRIFACCVTLQKPRST